MSGAINNWCSDMTHTSNLSLPLLAPAQAQKHVTHNAAIQTLDALVQMAVSSRSENQPPVSPAEGDRHVIGPAPTEDWANHPGQLAVWQDNAWVFLAPKAGWLAWVGDEQIFCMFDGTAWVSFPEQDTLPQFGINTNADASNRLAVKSDAILHSHDDVTPGSGDVRHTMNKQQASSTASILLQSNWSGRAEIGLTGDEDLHFRTSADGAIWTDAIVMDHATGMATFPNTALMAGPGPQLIINGDFQINQREFSGGTLGSGEYGYDRWKATGSGADMSATANALTLASGEIEQVIHPAVFGLSSLAGTKITVSVEDPSADIAVALGTTNVQTGTIAAGGTGRHGVTLTVNTGDTGYISLKLAPGSSGPVTFSRVKAEIGTNVTAWQARPLPLELALCQQFYLHRLPLGGSGYAAAAGQTARAMASMTFPTTMLATPSVVWDFISGSNCQNTETPTVFGLKGSGVIMGIQAAGEGSQYWNGRLTLDAEI